MTPSGHILIIDDEASLRQTLARILQRDGYEVTSIASGTEGLSLITQHSFDLVYLDIRMPDMNGLEVLKKIHAELPDLPVILFTAQPDLHSAVEALRRGASDYLMKPLKPETVLARTRSILSEQQKKKRRKEILRQMEELQAELDALDGNPSPLREAPSGQVSDRFIRRGLLTLDLHTRRVMVAERPAGLAPTSFDYLLVLVRHAPNVVDYQTLVSEAQGYQVDAREAQELAKWHIHNIRQAIESDGPTPIHVINLRGTGYRLVTE
jgi:DNA-binding response OmpR family regulator